MPKMLTNVPMTLDQINDLNPGDKITLEYEVVLVTLFDVYVKAVASGPRSPSISKKRMQDRNGTLTFKAPFVPKPGELFKFGGVGDVRTLIFLDDRSIIYEDKETGRRYTETRLKGVSFVRA